MSMLEDKYNKVSSYGKSIPHHVAIIMDGNGRWASNQGKRRSSGHKAGITAVRKSVSFATSNQIKVLTLYAFSSDNWIRPTQEILSLMELFVWALNSEIKKLDEHNIKLNIIGNVSEFSPCIQDKIHQAQELTRKNDGMVLNIAANYSGRWDITQSVVKLTEKIQDGSLLPHQITEKHLARYLCTYSLAPVDLLIRTGGEHRISNFLLWQIAYAEFYFTDVLWPDFDEYIFGKALEDFSLRNRRYGNIK